MLFHFSTLLLAAVLVKNAEANCLKDPRFVYTPQAYCHHGVGIYDEAGARLKLDNCHSQCISHDQDVNLNSAADIPFEKQRTYGAVVDSTVGDDVDEMGKWITGKKMPQTRAYTSRLKGKEGKMQDTMLKLMKEMHECCCKSKSKRKARDQAQTDEDEEEEEEDEEGDEEAPSKNHKKHSKYEDGDEDTPSQRHKKHLEYEEGDKETPSKKHKKHSKDKFPASPKDAAALEKELSKEEDAQGEIASPQTHAKKKPTEEDLEKLKGELVKLYKEYSKFKNVGLADESFDAFTANVAYDEECQEAQNDCHNLCKNSPCAKKLRKKMRLLKKKKQAAKEKMEKEEKTAKEKSLKENKTAQEKTGKETEKEAGIETAKQNQPSSPNDTLHQEEAKIIQTLTTSQSKLTEQIAQLTKTTQDFFERCKCNDEKTAKDVHEIKETLTAKPELEPKVSVSSTEATQPKGKKKTKQEAKKKEQKEARPDCETIHQSLQNEILKRRLSEMANLKSLFSPKQVAQLMLLDKPNANEGDLKNLEGFIEACQSATAGSSEIAKALTANKEANLKQAVGEAFEKHFLIPYQLQDKLIFMLKDQSYDRVTVKQLEEATATFTNLFKELANASAAQPDTGFTFTKLLDKFRDNELLKELLPSAEPAPMVLKAAKLDSTDITADQTFDSLMWKISNRFGLTPKERCRMLNRMFNFLGWMSLFQGIQPLHQSNDEDTTVE